MKWLWLGQVDNVSAMNVRDSTVSKPQPNVQRESTGSFLNLFQLQEELKWTDYTPLGKQENHLSETLWFQCGLCEGEADFFVLQFIGRLLILTVSFSEEHTHACTHLQLHICTLLD